MRKTPRTTSAPAVLDDPPCDDDSLAITTFIGAIVGMRASSGTRQAIRAVVPMAPRSVLASDTTMAAFMALIALKPAASVDPIRSIQPVRVAAVKTLADLVATLIASIRMATGVSDPIAADLIIAIAGRSRLFLWLFENRGRRIAETVNLDRIIGQCGDASSRKDEESARDGEQSGLWRNLKMKHGSSFLNLNNPLTHRP